MEQLLKHIALGVLEIFRSDVTFCKEIKLTDYHGFMKGRIPHASLAVITKKYAVSQDLIQAELVSVSQDLSDEVHLRHSSHAYCVILGSKEHVATSQVAFAFKGGRWFKVAEGECISIPSGTPRGFTVKDEGIYFLSIQTPPIEGKSSDDYIKVKSTKLPY